MSRSAWLSVNTHAYPSWQKLLNWKDVWPNSRSSRAFRNPPLEVLDQSVFKRVVNACNKSQQQMTLKLEYIMLLNLIVLNEINLFLDYQLFSSCLFDDINGPVELLSLEAPPLLTSFFRDGHQQWVQPIQVQALKLSSTRLLLKRASQDQHHHDLFLSSKNEMLCIIIFRGVEK